MRILIGADTYYPNVDGASYFTQRLATQLKKRGHEILVIASSPTRHTALFSHDGVDCLGIFSLPTIVHKDYRFSPPFFIKDKIRAAIQNFKPDVVHIQSHFMISRTVAKVAQELGIPLVATNHFMPENLLHYGNLPERVEKQLAKLAWKDFCSVFKKISIVTTPTKTAADVLKNNGLLQPAIALSCGIDLKRFNPKNSGEYLRERYKIPNVPVLLSVGRLAPEKNVDQTIEAFSLLPNQLKAHLVIVGNGTERERLEHLAENLGIKDKVTFTGFVPDEDMAAIYSLAHVFVTAGEAELQSLVTMEAMASGLPVIAIRAVALPELVHENENGFLFEPGDVTSFSSYIERLFTDDALHSNMSQKSLEIIGKHDIEKTIPTFEKLYEQAINGIM